MPVKKDGGDLINFVLCCVGIFQNASDFFHESVHCNHCAGTDEVLVRRTCRKLHQIIDFGRQFLGIAEDIDMPKKLRHAIVSECRQLRYVVKVGQF